MNILAYPAALRGVMSVFLAVISFFAQLFGLPTYPHGKEADLTGYKLVFSDEFDGDSLDRTKWSQHGYTSDTTILRKGGYWNLGLCSVYDGNLHISTKYLENGYNSGDPAGWYSCGIDTRYSFMPVKGYFECRCILPKGEGQWAAFWMISDKIGEIDGTGIDGNEVDIFESAFYGEKNHRNTVQGAIHYDGYGDAHKQKQIYHSYLPANDPYEEFNTYALEWTDTEYIFYINGIEVARTDFGGICTSPCRVILSTEIGGENGTPGDSWAGKSVETNGFIPSDFIVDYVRIYQKK